MSLLKRQKRASSTHHGHQRDKTKWNPTALPVAPPLSSRLSPPSSPPLSFIHPPFLASTSCLRHFFFPSSPFISLPFSSLFSSLRPLHARFRLSLFFYSSSSSSFLSSREEGNTEREREAHKPFFTRRGEAQREQQQPTVSFLSRNLWANRSLPFPLAVLNAIFKNAEVE